MRSFCPPPWHSSEPQMHLGYHELRNMLSKFKEERDKRKAAGGPTPAMAPGAGVPPGGPSGRTGDRGDFRPSRGGEDYRDRGYDRHSSRYE